MANKILAVIVDDGFFMMPLDRRPTHEPEEATTLPAIVDHQEIETLPPMDGLETIVEMLARIVKIAQGLSTDDKRRARQFTEAARSLLHASTSLPDREQEYFQAALRRAAK